MFRPHGLSILEWGIIYIYISHIMCPMFSSMYPHFSGWSTSTVRTVRVQVGQHQPSRTSQTCCSMKLMKSALMGNGGGLCDMSWHSLGPGFGCDIMHDIQNRKENPPFLGDPKKSPKKIDCRVHLMIFFTRSIAP